MAIERIKKASVSDEVYNQIINNISSKEWPPLSKLPSEVELSEQLGVSRISVRNAIQRLVGQGILESRHGEGTFVSDLSINKVFDNLLPLITVQKDSIIELYEFRRVLETGNIRLMAEQMTEDTLKDLTNCYQAMKDHQNEMELFIQDDRHFHDIIVKATGNSIVIDLYSKLRDVILEHQKLVQTYFGPKGGLKYHKLILDALKKKDFKAAEEYMDEHMRMSIKNVQTGKQNVK